MTERRATALGCNVAFSLADIKESTARLECCICSVNIFVSEIRRPIGAAFFLNLYAIRRIATGRCKSSSIIYSFLLEIYYGQIG